MGHQHDSKETRDIHELTDVERTGPESGGRRRSRAPLDGSLNRVKVMVSDGRQCRHLDLDVVQPDAIEAFNEQFARAAARLSVS